MTATQWGPYLRPPVAGVHVDRDVAVGARDGVAIRCDVYRPEGDERVPALFAMSPYQKDLAGLPAYPAFPYRETGPIEWYVGRGYAYVLADSRGTGASVDGVWAYLDAREQTDLYDVIEWIAHQPWCTGRVGMIGQSYFGVAQWCAAAQNPPHLACVAPYDARVDHYRDGVCHGGIPSLGYATSWSFGLRYNHAFGPPGPTSNDRLTTDLAQGLLDHPLDDEFWRERSPYWRLAECRVPVFSVGNWGKIGIHLRGNLLGYELVSGPRRMLIEEGGQPARLGSVRAQADFDKPEFHEHALLPWYEYWLKDVGTPDRGGVVAFVSGVDEYRTLPGWPLGADDGLVHRNLFLAPGRPDGAPESLNDGRLSWSPAGDARSHSEYSYPRARWHSGPVEIKSDGKADPFGETLTWTTPPLTERLAVVGPVELVVHLSTSERDTDVVVKLWDLDPANRAMLLTRGWLRASHRSIDAERSVLGRPFHDHRAPEPLEPGTVYDLRVEIWPLAHVFLPGHRLRLQLVNGDSALTDGTYTHYYGLKCGTDRVHHDATHRSRLVLPVADDLGA